MIVDVWSWTVASGKLAEVRDFMKRTCEYHESQDLVLRSYVLNPINGNRSKAYSVTEFESLATMEKYYADFWQNGWPKFKDDWDWGFFVEGSAERYQYETLDSLGS